MEDNPGKEQVHSIISQAIDKGKTLSHFAQDIQKGSQFIVDLGTASLSALSPINSGDYSWKEKYSSWADLVSRQDLLLASIKPASLQAVATASTAVAFSMVDIAHPEAIAPYATSTTLNEISLNSERIAQIIDRFENKGKAIELITSYRLDKVKTGLSPSTLLLSALEEYERPIDSPVLSGSLISVRECINVLIGQLLQRRPRQEPVPKAYDKVLSICKQLGSSSASQELIVNLASKWGPLADELSESKQHPIQREQAGYLLRRSLLFIIELLEILDPGKCI